MFSCINKDVNINYQFRFSAYSFCLRLYPYSVPGGGRMVVSCQGKPLVSLAYDQYTSRGRTTWTQGRIVGNTRNAGPRRNALHTLFMAGSVSVSRARYVMVRCRGNIRKRSKDAGPSAISTGKLSAKHKPGENPVHQPDSCPTKYEKAANAQHSAASFLILQNHCPLQLNITGKIIFSSSWFSTTSRRKFQKISAAAACRPVPCLPARLFLR
jgi:hypothetical protein